VKKIIYFGFVVNFVFLLVFCSDDDSVPYEKEFFFPDDSISYYEHVLPLIDAKCGFGSGCHNPSNTTNFLFFETKDVFITHEIGLTEPRFELVNPDVDKFNPTLSPLYQLLTVDFDKLYLGYERMPPIRYDRESLTTGELKGLEQWIRDGAED
jgi:hypothetical protein